MLEYRVYDSRANMGLAAAKDVAFVIKKLLLEKEEVSMIFAAAPSQNELLASLVEDKTIDFRRINAFHMDEYVGIPASSPCSFAAFLNENLFTKVPFKSVCLIDGAAADISKECERYAALLTEKKPEIVCMGIGENAHIAFNDPHEARFDDEKIVKIVSLDEICRNQQVRDGMFETLSAVPKQAVTLTIPALMAPAYAFCVVPAASKADAVFALLNGEIEERVPATALRRHQNAILYTDSGSAERIL